MPRDPLRPSRTAQEPLGRASGAKQGSGHPSGQNAAGRASLGPPLPAADLPWHWSRKEEGCPTAREALILHYGYLVPKTREKCIPIVPFAIDPEDLLSEGYLALVRAVDRYEPLRGVKFPSFAICLIQGAMREWLRKEDDQPRSVRTKQKLLAIAEAALRAAGRTPDAFALADELAMDLDELLAFQQAARGRRLVSLDDRTDPTDPTDPTDRSDQLIDPAPPVFEQVLALGVADELARYRRLLPGPQGEVLRRHYEEQETFREISGGLSRSETRVHQLHEEAIQRLREAPLLLAREG